MNKLSTFKVKTERKKLSDNAVSRLANWRRYQKVKVAEAKTTPILLKPRIALYMRYSTLVQDPFSFERQSESARSYTERLGGVITKIYGDAGESGGYELNRPEFLKCMADADNHEFDILLFEHADRLARSSLITTRAFSRLRTLGIEIHTVNEGQWTLFHAALFGAMSEEQRMRLSVLIRSGMHKLAIRQLWPCRAPLGFKKDKENPGELVKVPEAIKLAIRIFEMRRDRLSLDTIAENLEAEHIKSPNGLDTWNASTLLDLLSNSLYVGVGIYGMTRQERREEAGVLKRHTEHIDASEWHFIERPDWAVPEIEACWDQVQLFNSERARSFGPTRRYLLSRIIVCSKCGGPMTASCRHKGETYIRCNQTKKHVNRKRKGPKPCVDRQVKLGLVEDAVISLVCQKLDHPNALKAMQNGYARRVGNMLRDLNQRRKELEGKRKTIDKKLSATLDAALATGLTTKAVQEQRQQLCAAQDKIDEEMASLPVISISTKFEASPVESAPYLETLIPLKDYRGCDENVARLVQTFRSLVGRVSVSCHPDGRFDVNLDGPISEVTGDATAIALPTERRPGKARAALSLAKKGEFRLTDSDWEAVSQAAPVDPIWHEHLDQPLDFRSVIEAILFIRNTGVGYRNFPQEFWGPKKYVWAVARMMSYCGLLDVVEEQLKKANCALVKGITLAFDYKRSRLEQPIVRYIESNARRRDRVHARLKNTANTANT